MILEECWDGLWTHFVGLSQFHGHGSYLMCEVALSIPYMVVSHHAEWDHLPYFEAYARLQ